jgi:hypothetical protein
LQIQVFGFTLVFQFANPDGDVVEAGVADEEVVRYGSDFVKAKIKN